MEVNLFRISVIEDTVLDRAFACVDSVPLTPYVGSGASVLIALRL